MLRVKGYTTSLNLDIPQQYFLLKYTEVTNLEITILGYVQKNIVNKHKISTNSFAYL